MNVLSFRGGTTRNLGRRESPPRVGMLLCTPGAMREYYVYIMSNDRWTLNTGVTNDLLRRVYEHKRKLVPGFTAKYNVTKLVYFESTPDVGAAIAREKQIKAWRRSKKVDLINSVNPAWKDLAADWLEA